MEDHVSTQLPNFQSTVDNINTPFQLMQSKWSGILNPILANPLTNPRILKSVVLASGINVINTGLADTLQGWFVTDINAAITIYRSQPKAPLTLTLTCSGIATADIAVF